MQSSSWEVLEGLRAVLALHVLFVHANVTPKFVTNSICQFPSTAFFIVLSGFSLGRTYALRSWNISSILTFYRKRLTRIFPSHLFSHGVLLLHYITTVSKYLYFCAKCLFIISTIYKE